MKYNYKIKTMKKIFILSVVLTLFTSCYVHKYSVGSGAEGMKKVTEKQHNFIYGLASGKTPDTQKMADGAENYDVKSEQTFIDGLINSLTFGIYNPTTITVTK